jgi:hypothetical protein
MRKSRERLNEEYQNRKDEELSDISQTQHASEQQHHQSLSPTRELFTSAKVWFVKFVRAVKAESASVSYTHTCFVWGRKRDRGRGRGQPHPTWEMFWDVFEEL